jgi:hypothetical protein
MDVAPHLARTAGGGPRTVALAARYLVETMDAALGAV